jgi:hypothetical protein
MSNALNNVTPPRIVKPPAAPVPGHLSWNPIKLELSEQNRGSGLHLDFTAEKTFTVFSLSQSHCHSLGIADCASANYIPAASVAPRHGWQEV